MGHDYGNIYIFIQMTVSSDSKDRFVSSILLLPYERSMTKNLRIKDEIGELGGHTWFSEA